LATKTSGLANYRVQYRQRGTTTWNYLVYPTTATSTSQYLYAGRIYDFRVQAKDNAGNYSAWAYLAYKP
jgi:hypothetical protein